MESESSAFGAVLAERREGPRYPVRWKASIVWIQDQAQRRINGRTVDLSPEGASIHCDHNLKLPRSCTMLLTMPLLARGAQPEILEIACNYAYTVCDGVAGFFRIGLTFVEFKGDGLKALKNRLQHYQPCG